MPQLTVNKKALHDYDVLEKFEAGIVLTGQEVKSIKGGHVNLRGSYVTHRDNQLFLIGCHVSPYRMATNLTGYVPTHDRRLLLKKKEVAHLIGSLSTHGLTIAPLSVYTKGGLIKVEVGVCRGRQVHDKRAVIKKREVDRSIRRLLRTKS